LGVREIVVLCTADEFREAAIEFFTAMRRVEGKGGSRAGTSVVEAKEAEGAQAVSVEVFREVESGESFEEGAETFAEGSSGEAEFRHRCHNVSASRQKEAGGEKLEAV